VSAGRAAHELLLACATWDASDRELERVALRAKADVDWIAWLEMARWHRLIPHAQRALLAARAPTPPDVATALLQETIAIGGGALARARQLLVVLDALRDAGVRALPFKGPVLALAAYGDLGARDSTDLDIVVMPRDLDRARDVLLAAGYISRTEMSRAQERVLQAAYGHFAYAAPDDGVMVELHWRFAARRYPWFIPPEEVFGRSVEIQLAGSPVPGPDLPDVLLLQAMHGARHQWERLEWLVAFVQLLKRVSSEDDWLIARAGANRSSRALQLALRLARDLLGAPLTPRFARLADDPRAAAHAAHISHTLEAGAYSTHQPYQFNMGVMDRPLDRARYIALSALCPTPREWELARLPDWLVGLYYPLRLARVLALQPVRLVRAVVRR
jgi:hypothetical protein